MIAVLSLLVMGGCGSDDDGAGGDSADTQPEAPGAAAPVELSGQVNEEGTADATGDDQLELATADFAFRPTYVKVTSGQTLTIEVVNEGDAPHTFTVDAASVDQQVEPGASASVQLVLPEADAVAFYCRFHKDGGMQGAFYVTEGAAVSQQPAATTGSSGAAGY